VLAVSKSPNKKKKLRERGGETNKEREREKQKKRALTAGLPRGRREFYHWTISATTIICRGKNSI